MEISMLASFFTRTPRQGGSMQQIPSMALFLRRSASVDEATGDNLCRGKKNFHKKKKKNQPLTVIHIARSQRSREQRCRCRMGSAQNSNYPGMAICPDIFQCSPQTICLKIPNAAAVQHSADGETSMLPFQANQPIVKPIALSPPLWRETGFGPTLHS